MQLAEAPAVLLFINSPSQHYSTCSCPIIINHSRAQADFACSPEGRCAVSCGLAPPTVQVHKVEQGDWDWAGIRGDERGGRGPCAVMEWVMAASPWPFGTLPLASSRYMHQHRCFSLPQHIRKHSHIRTLPLHPWSEAGGRLIMWCAWKMWDGSDTPVCSGFICLCRPIGSFFGGGLQEELTALKTLQREDLSERWWRPFCVNTHMWTDVLWMSAVTLIINLSIYLQTHVRAHAHMQYLSLLIIVQTVYTHAQTHTLTHTHTHTHTHINVTMAVTKNPVGIQLILNKMVI